MDHSLRLFRVADILGLEVNRLYQKVEMQAECLPLFDQHSREAPSILRRISNKLTSALQRQRLEGEEVEEELRELLRRGQRKAKTQLLLNRTTEHRTTEIGGGKQQRKNKHQLVGVRKTDRLPSKDGVQIPTELSNCRQNQLAITQNHTNGDLGSTPSMHPNPSVFQPPQSVPIAQTIFSRQKIISSSPLHPGFLPMLQQYIDERANLSSLSAYQQHLRAGLTQLMLLAWARRSNGKFLGALELLVDGAQYFEGTGQQLRDVRRVWYGMVERVFKEMKREGVLATKSQEKVGKSTGGQRWREPPAQEKISRRRRSIVVRSLASRRNFMSRVGQQLRKAGLVYESSYRRELTENSPVGEDGLLVLSMWGCAVGCPSPSMAFPSHAVPDYSLVLVRRDPQTDLFPRLFPISLANILSPAQYLWGISKVNSLLLPSACCWNFSAGLYASWERLLGLWAVIFGTVTAIAAGIRGGAAFVLIGVAVLMVLGLSWSVQGWKGTRDGAEVGMAMERVLKQWEERSGNAVKMSVGEEVAVLVLAFPRSESEEGSASGSGVSIDCLLQRKSLSAMTGMGSQSFEASERQLEWKRRLKEEEQKLIMEQGSDEMVQKGEGREEKEMAAQPLVQEGVGSSNDCQYF